MNRNPTHPSNEVFVVSPGEEGLRLDVFCASRLEGSSRSRIQKLIKSGAVLVDSAPRPSSHIVKTGETVRIEMPAPESAGDGPEPQEIPLRVVFEDDDIVVVNKHAGIVVHPAVGNPDGTVVNALLGRGIRLSGVGGRDRPGVVHRLDKDTSGLLVLAKTDRAYKSLAEQIGARKVRKTYHAIVWGHLGIPARRIDAPIARHPVDRQENGGGAARRPHRAHGGVCRRHLCAFRLYSRQHCYGQDASDPRASRAHLPSDSRRPCLRRAPDAGLPADAGERARIWGIC